MVTTVSESEMLQRCLSGDKESFGQIVERYQNLVCSVAYSIVGDFTRSEDIGQETFVTAWKRLSELKDLTKFRSWISTIARNRALSVVRQERANAELNSDHSITTDSPETTAISREEEDLVWQTLQSMPETYREPLVLFYRQECSVAQVAESMELSEAAVKQRLSRGRDLLRQEVANVVERTLRSSIPKAAFTFAVMGGLSGLGTATASAAVVGTAGKSTAPVVIAAAKTGILTGALGVIVGIGGSILGPWLAWKNARYESEREMTVRFSKQVIFLVGVFLIPLIALSVGWQPWENHAMAFGIGISIWVIGYFVALTTMIVRGSRQWKQLIRDEKAKNTPEISENPLRKWMSQWEGRHWTSKTSFLGLPLVQISMSDPQQYYQEQSSGGSQQGIAKGWIAIGERAYGVLLAIGTQAYGCVAMGAVSVGLFAFGALGIGLFTIAGLGIGAISFAGCSIGGITFGGVTLGWIAFGAIAVAWKAAVGVISVAAQYAIGNSAYAPHANDAAAKLFVEQSSVLQTAQSVSDWMEQFGATGSLAFMTIFSLIPMIVMVLVGYRRKPKQVSSIV